MEIPHEIHKYIRESIHHTLGLPGSTETLQSKLLHSQESLHLAEASINAQAVKRFLEENHRLGEECKRLLGECNKLEKECSLYDHDREALMDFGNEADERAKEAEIRVHDLEVEVEKVLKELNFYKHQYEIRGADSSADGIAPEENLLECILTTLVTEDEIMSGHAFLEGNMEHESCQSLLKRWKSLKPLTKKVLSLAAEIRTLEQDKEHLRMNLDRAEEEVNLLFEQNKILDAKNKRLLRQLHKERNLNSSNGKQSSSASAKTNKRKSSPKMSTPIEKIDFDPDSTARQPLSPLRYNSPDSRRHKK